MTTTSGYKVLDTIGDKIILSVDVDRYADFLEDLEMHGNRNTLQKRYSDSKKSGMGREI